MQKQRIEDEGVRDLPDKRIDSTVLDFMLRGPSWPWSEQEIARELGDTVRRHRETPRNGPHPPPRLLRVPDPHCPAGRRDSARHRMSNEQRASVASTLAISYTGIIDGSVV
jgi:hypothetical protein